MRKKCKKQLLAYYVFKVKESQLIRQIHVYSSDISDVLLQYIFKFNDEKIKLQVLQLANRNS